MHRQTAGAPDTGRVCWADNICVESRTEIVRSTRASIEMARPACEQMFDAEVISELRKQFDAADKDGSGEVDAEEACRLFARSCDEAATDEEIHKTADALRRQLDTDRSGTISFDEYCFRFGRRYQMELNRRKRSSRFASSNGVPKQDTASRNLDEEREKLEKEREAIRQERERLQLEKEREALRKEREALERERQASNTTSSSSSAQVLGPGMRVRIQGLRGAPELNGLEATVVRLDEASGRYVVDVAAGRGQKSLKDSNLVRLGAEQAGGPGGPGPGLGQKVTDLANSAFRGLQRGCAHVQVWLVNSGYTWWQVLLGVAVVVLVVSAVMQAGSRHSGRRTPSSFQSRTDRADFSEERTYRNEHREEPARHRRTARYEEDDLGYSDYDDSWSSGIGFGGMQKYLIIGGLVILCWKGIIPVHRMDWFQLYMLWNFLQSTGILGGHGGHYGGGFGRRRRSFF
eukprot:s1385_g23.t2